MPPKTPDQYREIRQEKRSQIKRIALELFANKGFNATSIAQIAKEVGMAKGLLYNYFSSKEDLLTEIFLDLIDEIMLLIDPNRDKVITQEEASLFIDAFFDDLISKKYQWKLFMQLSVQPGVMELLMKESFNKTVEDSQMAIYQYFVQSHSADPEMDLVLFSSLLKGFVLMYVFSPEMFTPKHIDGVKDFIKKQFIKPVIKNTNEKDINLDDTSRYLLL